MDSWTQFTVGLIILAYVVGLMNGLLIRCWGRKPHAKKGMERVKNG